MALKAMLFVLLAAVCVVGLWLRAPSIRTVLLIAVLIWSAARSYYFLFYVIHTYVDPKLRYSGLLSLVRQLIRQL